MPRAIYVNEEGKEEKKLDATAQAASSEPAHRDHLLSFYFSPPSATLTAIVARLPGANTMPALASAGLCRKSARCDVATGSSRPIVDGHTLSVLGTAAGCILHTIVAATLQGIDAG